MKRVKVGGATPDDGSSHLAGLETAVFGKLFPLVAHCAVTRYDDGQPRTPGQLQVKTQGSSWSVQVVDPDSCAFFTALATSLDDSLALASVLLESDNAPWEIARWLMAKKKK